MAADASIAVYDARFAKPVDRSLIAELAEAGVPILTIEEHTLQGGFGSAVLEAIEEMGLRNATVRRHGMGVAGLLAMVLAVVLAPASVGLVYLVRDVRKTREDLHSTTMWRPVRAPHR